MLPCPAAGEKLAATASATTERLRKNVNAFGLLVLLVMGYFLLAQGVKIGRNIVCL